MQYNQPRFSSQRLAKVRSLPTLPSLTYPLSNVAVFISEITARAYLVAEQHKRRTLAKADVARALSKSDQFDFLIDIVPREEGSKRSARGGVGRNDTKPGPSGTTAGESSTAGEASVPNIAVSTAETARPEGLIAEVRIPDTFWTLTYCALAGARWTSSDVTAYSRISCPRSCQCEFLWPLLLTSN